MQSICFKAAPVREGNFAGKEWSNDMKQMVGPAGNQTNNMLLKWGSPYLLNYRVAP